MKTKKQGPEGPCERPILMNPGSMQGLLDNRKRQTRRIMNPQPGFDGWSVYDPPRYGRITSPHSHKGKFGVFIYRDENTRMPEGDIIPCPYGQPGDRLWVRETWAVQHEFDHLPPRLIPPDKARVYYRVSQINCGLMWRPSIFMPRWASRALLELEVVRVQRLQEIGFDDCLAEGIYRGPSGRYADYPSGETIPGWQDPRESYRTMWDSINAVRGQGWGANPWVWALSFKVLELKGRPAQACIVAPPASGEAAA